MHVHIPLYPSLHSFQHLTNCSLLLLCRRRRINLYAHIHIAGEIGKLASVCASIFHDFAVEAGSEDDILHHAELKKILVDWKGGGEVYTDDEDVDNFVYLAQKELNVPSENRSDYIDKDLFSAMLSLDDFRSPLWARVADRLFSMMDVDGKGTINAKDLHTLFSGMQHGVTEGGCQHLIEEFKSVGASKKGTKRPKRRSGAVNEAELRISKGSEFTRFLFSGVFGSDKAS